MYIIFGILGGLMGLTTSKGSGVILWIVVGILTAEVLVQRGKIATLEKTYRPLPSRSPDETVFGVAPAEVEPVGFVQRTEAVQELDFPVDIVETPETIQPVPLLHKSYGQGDVRRGGFFDDLGDGVTRFSSLLTRFFTGGNLVLKVGIIIIFFGVVFLLKYAAQRNLVPIEFRLIGVALGGLALLGSGWWLRRRILGYGLILQGGGIGILYLVVYAAAKLYHLLPVSLSFAVMVAWWSARVFWPFCRSRNHSPLPALSVVFSPRC